jgi:hypothetical protein
MRDKHEELKNELDALFADCDCVDEICEQRDFIISIVGDWASEKIRDMRGPRPVKNIEEISDYELEDALKSYDSEEDPTDLMVCFREIMLKEKERRARTIR